eukprot:511753_1
MCPMFRQIPTDTDDEQPIPTLTHTLPTSWINNLFHVWVFRFIRLGSLDFDDLPQILMPAEVNVNIEIALKHWDKTKQERMENNLSSSTISIIYHTEKDQILKLCLLGMIQTILIFIAYFIFQYYLWNSFNKINSTNFNELIGYISFHSFGIFILFCIKSFIASYVTRQTSLMIARVTCSLSLSVYNKILSLDINECDKQQVLAIIGTDVEQIGEGLVYLLPMGVFIFVIILFSIFALFYVIGISALFGILFMLFIGVPFQLYGGFKFAQQTQLRMNFSDKRTQLITELIRGIRVLKLSANELPLMHKINEYRNNESYYLKKRNIYLGTLTLANFLIPSMMLFIILIFYSFVFKNKIDSNIVLFAVMILMLTAMSVRGVPVVVGFVADLITSAQRIDEFFLRKSISLQKKSTGFASNYVIAMHKADFIWTKRKTDNIAFSLNDLCVEVTRGKLVAIVGAVGCGKTSFIHSILGEMKCINGETIVSDNIVYCSQVPFIRNVTLRDNIILNSKYDETKYKQCIYISGLLPDLDKLPNYDLTLIGDEGVNLSGGQKMRVSFARALYRNDNDSNNIFLFDDPLSCVDIFVGRHMFFNGIYNYLLKNNNNNTCLMVINSHLHLLKYFDEIIIMNQGCIEAHLPINELFFNDDNSTLLKQFQPLLPEKEQIINNNHDNKQEDIIIMNEDIDDVRFSASSDHISDNIMYKQFNSSPVYWHIIKEFFKNGLTVFDYKSHWYNDENKVKESEIIRNSNIKLLCLIIPLVICYLLMCCVPMCDIWLIIWMQNVENEDTSTIWYLSVWFVIVCIIATGTLIGMYLFGVISTKSVNYIHSKSLYNILRANTLFFDITPRGDILNRFISDVSRLDINLPVSSNQSLLFSSSSIGYLIAIIIFIPYSLIAFVVIFPLLIYLLYRFKISYLSTLLLSKELISPVMTLFSESSLNLDSIRAYN